MTTIFCFRPIPPPFTMILMAVGILFYGQVEAESLQFTDHLLSGRIYDTRKGVHLAEPELMDALDPHHLVLIGEKHDNDAHHRIKFRLLEHLVSRGTRVVFEMLDESQQPLIDTLDIRDSPETLQKKLEWSRNPWPWEDYGLLVTLVLQRNGIVVAGNIDRNRMNAIYRGDHPLPGTDSVLDEESRSTILEQLYVSHCETIPRDALGPMLDIQMARDAAMANAMLNSGKHESSNRSILVTGGFHSRRDLGVPAHIRARNPGAEMVVIMLMEVEKDLLEPSDYPQNDPMVADYLWFTPATSVQDYCSEVRQSSGD